MPSLVSVQLPFIDLYKEAQLLCAFLIVWQFFIVPSQEQSSIIYVLTLVFS